MTWEVIAEGSPDTFDSTGVIDDLPHGTRFRIEIDTFPGLAYVADIWGAEWVAARFLGEAQIIDVYSDGWDKVVVEAVANSPLAVVTLIYIILGIVATGLISWAIYNMRVWAEVGDGFDVGQIVKWGAIGILGVLAFKAFKTFKEGR